MDGRKFVRLVGILSHSSVGGKGLAPGYLNEERALQGCEQEVRPIDVDGAPHRLFNVEKTWAEAERDLLTIKHWRSTNAAGPDQETLILHFSGHGTTTLEFEMPGGQRSSANPRFGAQLSRMIFNCRPQCVVLNACQSTNVARALLEYYDQESVESPAIVAWSTDADDAMCQVFADKFYGEVKQGLRIATYTTENLFKEAFEEAKASVDLVNKDPATSQLVWCTKSSVPP